MHSWGYTGSSGEVFRVSPNVTELGYDDKISTCGHSSSSSIFAGLEVPAHQLTRLETIQLVMPTDSIKGVGKHVSRTLASACRLTYLKLAVLLFDKPTQLSISAHRGGGWQVCLCPTFLSRGARHGQFFKSSTGMSQKTTTDAPGLYQPLPDGSPPKKL